MKRRFLILLILLLAFSLRVYGIESVPFSRDERQTLQEFVPLPIPEIFTTYHSNNHPVPSALAHLFSPNADNLLMMRWTMILLGMLSLPFIYLLGTDVFDRRVGLLALILMGASPTHIGYSIAVRGYIGLLTLSTMSLWFLVQAVQCNRWRDWIGFLVVNILVLYFHLFGGLAAWTQLALAGLWLVHKAVQDYPATAWKRHLKSVLTRGGTIVLLLAAVNAFSIYSRTQSVLAEGGYRADFDVWRDGTFLVSQEIYPLVDFFKYIMPVSPAGIGIPLFGMFFVIGLIRLWLKQRFLAIIILIWIMVPFFVIFGAQKILGPTFYVYSRFLIYLLPSIFIIIAFGIVESVTWLTSLSKQCKWEKQLAYYGLVVVMTLVIGGSIFFSLLWNLQASTHTNWHGIAHAISQNFQTGDIAICDEGQGFDVPDRPRAYCIWMLDLMVPELKEDSPQLLNSVNAIANYNFLYTSKESLLQPGGVWLVLWQKIRYWPGEYETNWAPTIHPPPPLSEFEDYQAWHFGTATLVKIDSGSTLLENIQLTLEMLVKSKETSLPDKARFYRSLAEIEAVQGHKAEAQTYYNKSWAVTEQAGGQYPDLFLLDTLPLVERIPTNESLSDVTVTPIGASFGESLCLAGLQVSSSAATSLGQTVELALHWQVQDFVDKDYVYYLSLRNQTDERVARIESDPFKRVYPTTWWWSGELLVDPLSLTIPPDLPREYYQVGLELVQRDTEANSVEHPLFLLKWLDDENDGHWLIEPVVTSSSECVEK